MGWSGLLAALAAFFVLHAIPVRPGMRSRLVSMLGRAGFGIAYSALSLATLALVLAAADRAPFVALWPEPPGAHWLVLGAMGAAGLILALGLGRPNPFSFGGGRPEAFDPDRPGILRWIRHPVLAAVLLWSGAHLAVNGDLAHALTFGSFAAFAAMGMRALDRRRQRDWGPAAWRECVARMRAAPPRVARDATPRLAAAIAGLALLLWAHPWIAGVGVLRRFVP